MEDSFPQDTSNTETVETTDGVRYEPLYVPKNTQSTELVQVDEEQLPAEHDEEDEDGFIPSNIDITTVPHPLDRIDPYRECTEEIMNKPGLGVALSLPRIPVPELPRKRGNKPGTVGQPKHAPTDEMRQYVFDALASGYNQSSVAHNLRISPNTLRKHYDYEIEMATDLKDERVEGSLYLDSLRASLDKGYQPSRRLYVELSKKLGKRLIQRQQVDHTNSDGSMQNIVFLPDNKLGEHVSRSDALERLKAIPEGDITDADYIELDENGKPISCAVPTDA